MSIRLKWLNRNTVFDSVIIYRSLDPINLDALPAPLVTLTNGEKEYLDTTAPKAKLLWYAFGVKKGTEIVYSKSKPMMDVDYTGPGPQEIALGNWFQGYFGTLPVTDLATSADLVNKFGIGVAVGDNGALWHKFAHRGKVLYFCSSVSAGTISWNLLYSKGLVFGVNGVGPVGHGNPAVNQWQTFIKGDDQLLVRLPRTNLTPDYAGGSVDTSGEWTACILGLNGNSYAAPEQPQNVAALGSGTGFTTTVGTIPLAEFQNNGAINGGCNNLTSNGIAPSNAVSNCLRTATAYWRPVLEYVFPY